MKTVASYILHYGKEWLYESMRSVWPVVDEIHLFYSPAPSHGHSTTLRNPELKSDLTNVYHQFTDVTRATNVYWHDAENVFAHEGIH